MIALNGTNAVEEVFLGRRRWRNGLAARPDGHVASVDGMAEEALVTARRGFNV
jgi:hypothetical protein